MPKMLKDYEKTGSGYAVFNLGEACLGIDIKKVQEINKTFELAKLYHVPGHIKGLVNLRGNIVTVIDLSQRLGLAKQKKSTDTGLIMIVQSKGEQVGLLVDRVNDVIQTDSDRLDPVPPSLSGLQGGYLKGVLKIGSKLIGILSVKNVVS